MLKKAATILQLIPEVETGGAERGCVDMAVAIHQAGGRALVISAGGKMVAELEASGATHITWTSIKSKNPFIIIGNAVRLKALLKAERVDLIHARSRAPAWVGYMASRMAGVPFITTFHSTYNFRSRLKHWYNSVMARGARVIAISRFIQNHIEQSYPDTDPDNIRLIHRGINIEKFDPAIISPASIARMRTLWGVPDGATVVLLPGRLTRWKGQGVLIEAMEKLRDTNAFAVCVGADQGRTEYRDELRNKIVLGHVEGRVMLAGECNDMPTAYAAADIVVSASIEPEAFGRVIVEAQAMGKPVVVSNLGAVAETAGETGFGWIVPPNNAAALAKAIKDVLVLPETEKSSRAATSRNFILNHYTRAKMCAATLGVYNELL